MRAITSRTPFLSAVQLADVATYGLVGETEPESIRQLSDLSGLPWLAEDDTLVSKSFHHVSADLRAVVLALGNPIADQRIVGALIALSEMPSSAEEVVLSLPVPQGAMQTVLPDLQAYLTPRAQRETSRKALMLREHRRQILNLSAKLPREEIQNAIYDNFFLPVARRILEAHAPGRRVHVTTQPPPAHVSSTGFAPLQMQADDPVSENVFALAMRTRFHGQHAAQFKPWLKLSPFHYGLSVRRSDQPSDLAKKLALAVPQICLLTSACPPPELKG